MLGEDGPQHLAPRSIETDRPGFKSRGGKQAHQGKDALFSFDQQNLEMFSLPKGGVVGGGVPGTRGLAGSRKKARPSKTSAESAAPKGTEGATGTGPRAVAASLSKMFPAPPVRASVPESPGRPYGSIGDGDVDGDHTAGMFKFAPVTRSRAWYWPASSIFAHNCVGLSLFCSSNEACT